MIRLYLSLEALRFRQSFVYFIEVDEVIDADEMQVPTLLIQPYIENAVWHGLRMKKGEKKLWIRFFLLDDKLRIEVEDNGIGREKAAVIKSQKIGAEQFESKGTVLSQQRIDILNRQYTSAASVTIIDVMDDHHKPAGTRVVIEVQTGAKSAILSKPFAYAKNTNHR
jgi:LytS/YehU family sensor histidine kinase